MPVVTEPTHSDRNGLIIGATPEIILVLPVVLGTSVGTEKYIQMPDLLFKVVRQLVDAGLRFAQDVLACRNQRMRIIKKPRILF